MQQTLCSAAFDILTTADPREKARKTRIYAEHWRMGEITDIGHADVPARPARPEKPDLLMPRDMPKRARGGTGKAKIALLHALAHIELNAIDLSWDIIAREFEGIKPYCHFEQSEKSHNAAGDSSVASLTRNDTLMLPKQFYTDWIKVADDEAKHFLLLEGRLNDLGASYGDLPAHDGLWESSEKTAHDFAARLAIVPMVLEARGLDVTPAMIDAMQKQDDQKTAEILQIIHDDEITHVRAGTVWFEEWCAHHGKDVEEHWQHLVRTYFNGVLKRPFNHPSREEAGMIRDWYEPLAEALND